MSELAVVLTPLVERVRTDVTAVKKPNGEQAWTRQPLTPERIARHLNGGPARGVSPIRAGESVTAVALLDFDSHRGEVPWIEMGRTVRRVAELLELHGMQPIVWRSSGGRGLHLYLLWAQPQPAAAVRAFLADTLAAAGLTVGTKGVKHGAVEVFPKQDAVPVDGYGNQFILPLAGKSDLLEWVELADEYLPVPRERLTPEIWADSPPVPKHEGVVGHTGSEEAPPINAAVDPSTGEALWRAALDAIPNGRGGEDLDYDAWRNVVFAIHHETGGSDAGLALAHEFSSRSPKYDAAFLDNRVWPYVRSDRGGAVITGRSIMSIAARYGWHEPLDESAFEPIPDPDGDDDAGLADADPDSDPAVLPAQADRRVGPRADGNGAGSLGSGAIPEARHLATDQANANRIVTKYGKKVMVSAGRWHVYDGKRWLADEADIYRFGCNLSKIVTEEAEELDRKAARLESEMDSKVQKWIDMLAAAEALPKDDPSRGQKINEANSQIAMAIDPEEKQEVNRTKDTAEKLHKWSTKCEMKSSIEAAIGLARKMLTIDARLLDANSMHLNCNNGTVDLFTGQIRPHRSKDLITKLIPIDYLGDDSQVKDAKDRWHAIVTQITNDPELAGFLRRWFGYCATASVREQVMVVHWGKGRNGKSTIIETIRTVLGDYAGTAAPGLLTEDGKGFERHPTEVASLLGKRMITAHESDEGAQLREGFIKQATGGDQLKARYMREDFFDFDPTHKLQLLTNHKPTIKGTDPGIWRRVLLVPYTRSFGTRAQFEAGQVTNVADNLLGEALKNDPMMLRGVLAWIVEGAMEWSEIGLAPPAVVLEASRSYQNEQDRVGQFVRECCEVAPPSAHTGVLAGTAIEWCEPLTQGMDGLYPAYSSWAKDGGFFPLSRQRFVESLRSTLPVCHVAEGMVRVGERRRKVLRVFGLRLLEQD